MYVVWNIKLCDNVVKDSCERAEINIIYLYCHTRKYFQFDISEIHV